MVCRFFVVMPWGRVGSNLVMNLIGQAKESKKLNSEMFNQLKTAAEQLVWLREFYEFCSRPAVGLIGSKQSVLSIRDLPAVESALREHEVKLVRMRRDDCLKAAVSQIRAEQYASETLKTAGRARWAVRKGELPLGPTYLDPETLLRRIGIMKKQQDIMLAAFSGLDVLEIEYEEINANLAVVYSRLAQFLGFQPRAYSVPFIKATPDDIREAIENYQEVRDAVDRSPYADCAR